MDVKQLNKIMKFYYFFTLKALWDGQGKIKVYYGMSRVKKQLPGKRSITLCILNIGVALNEFSEDGKHSGGVDMLIGAYYCWERLPIIHHRVNVSTE